MPSLFAVLCLVALLLVASVPVYAQANSLVMTPYGLVPRSRVIELDSKTTTTVVNGRLLKVELGTGNVLEDFGELTTEDLTARDPREHAALLLAGVSKRSSVPAGGSNHVGYTVTASAKNISSFSTRWVVPDLPENMVTEKTTFLWNGLDGGALQPVMQWDNGHLFAYTLTNWCFNNGFYHFGQTVSVTPGTSLTGVITFLGKNYGIGQNDSSGAIDPSENPPGPANLTWVYEQQFLGYPEADITVFRNTEATGVIVCWEAYTGNTTQWPANLGTAMYDINLLNFGAATPPILSWSTGGGFINTSTGFNTVYISNSSSYGEIDFYWGGASGVVSGAVYKITSAVDNVSVLALANGYCAQGTAVDLGASTFGDQLWRAFNAGDGYTRLVPLASPTNAMGVSAGGAQVEIYGTNTTDTKQLWAITPVANSNYYSIVSVSSPSGALDVSNGVAQVLPANGGASQQFLFQQQSPPAQAANCTRVPAPLSPTPTPTGFFLWRCRDL